jgi:hypothetical protein
MAHMERKSPPLKSALVAGAALLLSTTYAIAAGPPVRGAGTGVISEITITPLRNAGGNQMQARTLTGVVDGSLDGTFEQDVTGTIHRNGHVTFGGVLRFTGTIEGCGAEEHEIMLGVSGRGEAGLPITEARVRVIQHPENTLAVTGHGTVYQEGAELAYEIQYIC